MAGLYVHIPYCRAKCAYCDFYSGPLRIFNEEQFFRAVDREYLNLNIIQIKMVIL